MGFLYYWASGDSCGNRMLKTLCISEWVTAREWYKWAF